jgi:hypothetical protein
MGMPGMSSPGGTPGFYDREMAKVNPIRPGMDDGRVYAGGSPGLYAPDRKILIEATETE